MAEARCALRLPLALALASAVTVGAVQGPFGPQILPARGTAMLRDSLKAAEAHPKHVWRDIIPINADGTINAYVEIPLGDRRKFEFDMTRNARAIDRMIPEQIGGYPINYGFVPQTVSYDGDPFDALVLGPPLAGGRLVRGRAVGVMFMEDEKGLDSKVVLAPLGYGQALTTPVQRVVADYFRRYKSLDPGAFSRVPGWGSADEGMALVRLTHAFFEQCGEQVGACAVASAH